MARVRLIIEDPTQHMTLRTMLEADGHIITTEDPEVAIASNPEQAVERARQVPTLLLATASEIPDAVRAMRKGVAGYLFVPIQPGEASVLIQSALRAGASSSEDNLTAEEMAPLEQVEMDYIQSVLRKCKHNQARAARVLGIGRNTLWRKLKKNAPPSQEAS